MNMSYCRFQNTLEDLRDCAEHINDEDLSHEENRARRWLIETCRDILAEVENEDDYEEVYE